MLSPEVAKVEQETSISSRMALLNDVVAAAAAAAASAAVMQAVLLD